MLRLVEEGHVDGWDDPRMPTLSGMRREEFTPASIRSFCERVGLAKRENIIEMELLEFCLREDLNKCAQQTRRPQSSKSDHCQLSGRTGRRTRCG